MIREPHIARAMNYTNWLRRQVARLENEIRSNQIFDTENPATQEQLRELRQTIVLHTYLKQQLLRRESVQLSEEVDTNEYLLVPVSTAR